jgi:hypothetical protein
MSDARAPAIRKRKTRDDLAHLSGLERGAYRVFEFLSSIRLAVVVLPWLILECIAGALIEAKVNTGAARYFVYGAWHFYLCLGLLALNIFCAALIRFPWKRYQTGFVVTHIGLLVLLFGSFLTLRHKLDSLMVAEKFEGDPDEKRWRKTVVDPAKEVLVLEELDPEKREENGEFRVKNTYRAPVDFGPFSWGHKVFGFIPWKTDHEETFKLASGDELRVKQFFANCTWERDYVPAEPGVSGSTVVNLALTFQDEAVFAGWVPVGADPKPVSIRFGALSRWKVPSDEHVEHFVHARPKETPAVADEGGGLLGWLTVSYGDKEHRFRVDDLRRGKTVPIPNTKDAIEVVDYFPDARLGGKEGTLTAGSEDPNNPGLHLKLVKDGKTTDAFVLADPFKNRAISDKQPAPYRFKYRTTDDAGPGGGPSLAVSFGNHHATFTLDELRQGPATVPGTQTRVQLLEYLASARVKPDGSGLTSEEGGSPNPAVRLAVEQPGKPRAEVLAFGDRYLDGMIDARRDVRVTLFTPATSPTQPLLELVTSPSGRIGYRLWSSTGFHSAGELEIGTPVPAWTIPQGNVTLQLTARGVVANGRPDLKLTPKPLEPRTNGERGAVVELRTRDGKATVNLARNPDAFDDKSGAVTLQIKDRLLRVRLASEELDLPFAIRLEDFIEPKIPGTNRPAMFTSIVTLKDERRKIEEKSVITMNRPLRHTAMPDGQSTNFLRSLLEPLVPQSYALYQTSISQTQRGPMSTYTVSRDPGIIIKYVGFITSTVGIFLMFYLGGYFRTAKAKAPAGSVEGDDE